MAKRKHAAALFEVIHHGEKHATSRSDAWAVPSLSAWMRKGRKPRRDQCAAEACGDAIRIRFITDFAAAKFFTFDAAHGDGS